MKKVEIELYKWILSDRRKQGASVLGTEHSLNSTEVARFAVSSFAEALRMSAQFDRVIETDLKLRLALHLCPNDAMNWDSTSSLSRVEVIADYIRVNFKFDTSDAIDLARTVATTLRAWETRRATLANRVEAILGRQGGKCLSCHVAINEDRIREEEKKDLVQRDHFKPYFLIPGVRSWLSPEVDHKDPISVFGTNDWSNLQILCRLCNAGKADSAILSTKHEYDQCHLSISEVKDAHRRRMMYSRFEMDDFTCCECSSKSNELTIRKRREAGCLVLSNLKTVCYACAVQ